MVADAQPGTEPSIEFTRIPFTDNYKVTVKGTSRQLRPIISGEVYRVCHEALVNALRHSQANRIELEMEYTAKNFRVLVRDNGIGINSTAIQQGHDVRLGLSGMRERADEIGGQLRVWSKANAGTEVELTIASQLAYESGSTPQRWFDGWHRGRPKVQRT
jgi:signal transduction histidine kinase